MYVMYIQRRPFYVVEVLRSRFYIECNSRGNWVGIEKYCHMYNKSEICEWLMVSFLGLFWDSL